VINSVAKLANGLTQFLLQKLSSIMKKILF